MTGSPLLSVRALGIHFPHAGVAAVHDLSFDIAPGEMVALVGGSGSGKSATALAIMGLSDPHAHLAPETMIAFDGVNLDTLDAEGRRALRGRMMAMIFQDPSAALNPAMTVIAQVAETVLVHGAAADGPAGARAQAEAMLARVGIGRDLVNAYPHELSGGQCQRVMIAMALVLRPALIIADEPTSALDTLTQSRIVALLRELREETGSALLLVSHDLGVVASLCTRVLVLHDGRLVEDAPTARLLAAPAHPVSAALGRAVPRLAGAS